IGVSGIADVATIANRARLEERQHVIAPEPWLSQVAYRSDHGCVPMAQLVRSRQHLAQPLRRRDDAGPESCQPLIFECNDIVTTDCPQRGKAPPIGDPLGPGTRGSRCDKDVGVWCDDSLDV